MWWKSLSVILLVYAFIAGITVPLKPGITIVSPAAARSGQTVVMGIHGYNTNYSQANPSDIRIWLQYDSAQAIQGQNVRIINDTLVEASFVFPSSLPSKGQSAKLNAIIDDPANGVALLPDAVELLSGNDSIQSGSWSEKQVQHLHVIQNFRFPYRNVLYETIRNLFFHVPMWMVLFTLFTASVVFSLLFLYRPGLEYDRYAAAFAETGLLFGSMGLITGMLWANYTWGSPWSNDIKQLMTAVALLVYLAYFILRRSFDEPEKGARLAAVYNIFAFASLIPLLYIIPRMFASLHPGATGNPAFGKEDLDNTMRFVFYPAIIGWILLGVWITQLRVRYQRLEDKVLGLD